MNTSSDIPPHETQSHPAHETSDVSPSAIGLFALGLVLALSLVLPLLGWTFWQFEAAARRVDPPRSLLSNDQSTTGPKLQEQPAADLARFRRQEDQRLSNYGWIDKERGIVHVPIELAIQILAERGLPETTAVAPLNEIQDQKP